jgi:hypothetical protein
MLLVKGYYKLIEEYGMVSNDELKRCLKQREQEKLLKK